MGISKRSRKREPDRLYQRNGIYYARLTVDGTEQRQSLKTSDRAEAERRLEQWLEGRSPYRGTVRHTFREAAELWWEAGEWKDKTLKSYAQRLATIDTQFGDLFWDQVDKAKLQEFILWLKTPRPRHNQPNPKPAGTSTINRYLTVIAGIADHVRDLPGWPETNPVRSLPVKPRKEKNKQYVRPPAEDIEAIFARMRGTFGDMARLALLTGARKDELVTLKAADARGGKLQLWETKHKFRVISINVEARAIVDKQPAHRSGYLFNTANGGPYKRATEMWREIVKRAQNLAHKNGGAITPMRFHDLRHEYAIRYLENGGSIYTLQQLLGHSTIGQTEEYLRYLTPENAAEAKR